MTLILDQFLILPKAKRRPGPSTGENTRRPVTIRPIPSLTRPLFAPFRSQRLTTHDDIFWLCPPLTRPRPPFQSQLSIPKIFDVCCVQVQVDKEKRNRETPFSPQSGGKSGQQKHFFAILLLHFAMIPLLRGEELSTPLIEQRRDMILWHSSGRP
jgi:hypothetical protein